MCIFIHTNTTEPDTKWLCVLLYTIFWNQILNSRVVYRIAGSTYTYCDIVSIG